MRSALTLDFGVGAAHGCRSAEPQIEKTTIGRAAITADSSKIMRHSVGAPVCTIAFVSSLFAMPNHATKKNDTPVMTPENAGASWTNAVCTPGVCSPENYRVTSESTKFGVGGD